MTLTYLKKSIIAFFTILLFMPFGARAAQLFECPDLANELKQDLAEMSQGKDGWFFRELADLREYLSLTPETQKIHQRLKKALNKKGTEMVVIPIPSRGLTGSNFIDNTQKFQNNFSFNEALASYNEAIKEWRNIGIIVPNIMEYLEQNTKEKNNFYFKRDHHWSEKGSKISASITAKELSANEQYKNIKKAVFKSTKKSTVPFKEHMGNELERLCSDYIPPENMDYYETKLDEKGEDALFGDIGEGDPPVLVGTSFSDVDYFNFAGFLSEHTGLNIANHAISGGYLYNSIISYVSSKRFKRENPPFLFWEIPMSYTINNGGADAIRQIIPAIYGECKARDAIKSIKVEIENGKPSNLFKIDAGKKISGNSHYIFINSPNRAFNRFTLVIDYDDEDGEWFSVDRSERFKNEGRYFVEFNDEITSSIINISIDNMPKINTELDVRICKSPQI